MAATPALPSLVDVELGAYDELGSAAAVGDAGAVALAEAPTLRVLRRLALPGSRLTGDGLRALPRGGSLPALSELVLDGGELGEGAAHGFLGSPKRLEAASLRQMELDAELLAGLLESPALDGVLDLRLAANELGDEGARALAACPRLRELRRLDVSDCQIGPAGARALAASPHLGRLRRLHLSDDPIGDDGMAVLVERLPELRALRADRCQIGDHGIARLARSARAGRLCELSLTGNALGDAALGALAAKPTSRLRILRLSDPNGPLALGPDTLARLVASAAAASLNELVPCVVADDARPHAAVLAAAPALPHLVRLGWMAIGTNGVALAAPRDGRAALTARWADRASPPLAGGTSRDET